MDSLTDAAAEVWDAGSYLSDEGDMEWDLMKNVWGCFGSWSGRIGSGRGPGHGQGSGARLGDGQGHTPNNKSNFIAAPNAALLFWFFDDFSVVC